MSSRFVFNHNNYLRFGLPASIRSIRPWCGQSLKSGAKLVAVAQMTMSSLWAAVYLFAMLSVSVIHKTYKNANIHSSSSSSDDKIGNEVLDTLEPEMRAKTLGVATFAAILILFFIMLIHCGVACLHLYLYQAVQKDCLKKVDRWWKIMLFISVFAAIKSFATLASVSGTGGNLVGVSEVMGTLIDCYSLWLIYEYKMELLQTTDPTVEFERVL